MKPASFVLLIVILFNGCSTIPSVSERIALADTLTVKQAWQAAPVKTDLFTLMSYYHANIVTDESLTIYIEGDGLSWINRRKASPDPTPTDPLALRLALAHPAGNTAYLGRPCQYSDMQGANCDQRYWTDARFSEEVITATNQAIDIIKQRFGATRLNLVGYSGGGAIVVLLAARRSDIDMLITVAGNLDHEAWTKYHSITPLRHSLNPVDWRFSIKDVAQVHYTGSRDKVVPEIVVHDYFEGYPGKSAPVLKRIEGYDHFCCWVEQWAHLYGEALK